MTETNQLLNNMLLLIMTINKEKVNTKDASDSNLSW
jgi:hypothetical protein